MKPHHPALLDLLPLIPLLFLILTILNLGIILVFPSSMILSPLLLSLLAPFAAIMIGWLNTHTSN
jgi:hypothetical protein